MKLSQIKDQQVQLIIDFAHGMASDLGGDMNETELREEADLLLKQLQFAPMGDNHHNARMCPYCSPQEKSTLHPSWESPLPVDMGPHGPDGER